ncbi:MAG: hypothetical protein CMJ64_21975 [Planctomycetaceae bacterium]|nr:hypothetical protein [Planctomycetaceae bacterium]
MGLAISRNICEALGGRLTVESELGVGSVFTASIAATPADPQTPQDGDSTQQAAKESATAKVDLSGRKILVVDDGDTNRKLVQLILKRSGADVVTASNGLEGVHVAQAQHPEIILMDMQMPIMDGYSATRQLRASGVILPIIALTAHAMKGDEERCLDAGCSDYLTKPVDAARVLAMVAEWLSTGQQQEVPASDLGSELDTVEVESIHSTLPLDDVEFCEIVIEFVERLRERLIEMRRVHSTGASQELARLAHWLKGAGGTAGFHDLTEPARGLEQASQSDDSMAANTWLNKTEEIASRIELPQMPVNS